MASPERICVAAVPGILVQVPGANCVHGGRVEYLGRRACHHGLAAHTKVRQADKVKVVHDHEKAYPPDPEHNSIFERDSHLPIFGELYRLIREGSVAAGDEATATWAGVKFNPTGSPRAWAPAATTGEESK